MTKSKKHSKRKLAKKPIGKSGLSSFPSFRQLVVQSMTTFRANWQPILAVAALYGLVHYVVIQGVTAIDVESISTFVSENFDFDLNKLGASLFLTASLFGLGPEISSTSSFLSSMLVVINSLALIWILRHIWLGRSVSVKESYYKGMYPLVPYALVVLVCLLQLIPFLAGSYIVSIVLAKGIAIAVVDKVLTALFFVATLLLSGYLLIGPLLATYIVTIPDMTPLAAMSQANKTLKGRRSAVLSRLIGFLLLSVVGAFLSIVSLVYIAPVFVPLAISALTVISLPWTHVFMFTLYRHLIED